ncbi:MAG: hypothetical protein M3432_03075 [Chloroflexota bacterium]|nr:hypothetical protein [Chloroflexota bacterium]
MGHPSLGLPPHDVTAGHPRAAARLRADRPRLARLALEAAARLSPGFADRYPEAEMRKFLRDLDQHIERLARALETGQDSYVTNYGEWLVPVYRRRGVPMRDFIVLLGGLRDAVLTVVPSEDVAVTRQLIERWAGRLKHHGRLPGDHQGNRIVRFFWKGAGIADDSVI